MEKGDAKTERSFEDIQKQMEEATRPTNYSTRPMTKHEECEVLEELGCRGKAVAASDSPTEWKILRKQAKQT